MTEFSVLFMCFLSDWWLSQMVLEVSLRKLTLTSHCMDNYPAVAHLNSYRVGGLLGVCDKEPL